MAHGEVEEGLGSKKVGLAAPNINVTPLIDVLLVLLIIFMVIQPKKEAKFESKIPQPAPPNAEKKQTSSKLLVVDVQPGGSGPDQQVQLNQQPLTLAGLTERLKQVLSAAEREDKTVFIKAPRNKSYGDVVAVVDAVKASHPDVIIALQVDKLPEK
ncbi:MAG TPA: biopolymer transporter ExbD [Blastocatellia bacterium]|nr:biopolymer transporter ExbD [Blastocatellia bacterium]